MTAGRGTWTGPDNFYAFQWQRDFGEGWVAIDGATGGSYTLTTQDVDALVRVLVTASNPDATIVEASDPTPAIMPAGPLNQGVPVVSGTAQRGMTLTGTPGSWSGTGNSYSYQWQASADGTTWTDLAGANTTAYPLGVSVVGHSLRLRVTASNADGTATTTSAVTARVVAAPPVNSVAPSITGTVQRAAVLAAVRGTWTGNNNVYSYQWQRDGVDIADATGASYTLTVDDVGKRVRVVVTATNPDATVTAASAPTVVVPSSPPVNTAPPTVSGTAQRGLTLTGTAGVWDGIGNSAKYQWQSSVDGTNWAAITGATSSTRVISTSEIGRFMRLLVTVTNAEGVVSLASAPTAKVVSAPPVNTVRPVISGTAQRGQTLVGTLGTWTGVENVYDHQWQRSVNGTTWTNIAGATRPSYELTVADVGSIVRLLVTATNPDGSIAASSTRVRDRADRAAGEHRPPDDHRHRPPGRRAERRVRHLERDRQRLGLPVAALDRQRHDVAEHRRRGPDHVRAGQRRRRCDRAPARDRLQPRGQRDRDEPPDRRRGRRRPGQHDRARDQRRRAPRVDPDGGGRHLERRRQRLRVPVAALHRRHHLVEHRRRDQRLVRARRRPTSARRCACS